MRTHIALLRGINVGGNKKIKMADLRAMLDEIGLEEAATLLQSGNVVFRSEGKSRAELESLLRRETASRLGVDCEYHVRTVEEWDRIVAENPFEEEARDDPGHLLVNVVKANLSKAEVEAFQNAILGPEVVKAGAECVYIYFPIGVGVSKIDRTPGWKQFGGTGTMRNWNTVLKLAQLVRE